MLRVLALSLLVIGCKKEVEPEKITPAPRAPAAEAPVAGARVVPVEAGRNGYVPEAIRGAAGEKLTLVFTRTLDDACMEELRTPDGKTISLPMNKPVEVAVTVPASGELTFACGMDMFRGKIVAGS